MDRNFRAFGTKDVSRIAVESLPMNSIPWRVQFGIVAAGYVAVLLLAALLVYDRHMQYVNHPADVMAAGGMYAGGDLILALFIGCLFFIPTFLLILVIRKSETAYTKYAQVLLGLCFTVPVCLLGLLAVANQENSLLGEFCFYRLLASPLVIVGLVLSWLFARFSRARQLILYALGIEAGTLVIGLVVFVIASGAVRGSH